MEGANRVTSLTADVDVVKARKYALAPVKEALEREGRRQSWLVRQLEERVGLKVNRRTLNSYLNGYARTPRNVLSATCWIAGVQERDVLARIADEASLIQPAKRKPRK